MLFWIIRRKFSDKEFSVTHLLCGIAAFPHTSKEYPLELKVIQHYAPKFSILNVDVLVSQ